jgi:hypothetical protein
MTSTARIVITSVATWLVLASSAQAMSCVEPIRITNHTDRQVSVSVKSFYGVRFSSPDPTDFEDKVLPPQEGLPFTHLYTFLVEPQTTSNVSVRTLCSSVRERRHWINWRYAFSGSAASGQVDLVTTHQADIHVREDGA